MSTTTEPPRGRIIIMRGHDLEKMQPELSKLVEEGYSAYAPVVMADFHGKMVHLVVMLEWLPPDDTQENRAKMVEQAMEVMRRGSAVLHTTGQQVEGQHLKGFDRMDMDMLMKLVNDQVTSLKTLTETIGRGEIGNQQDLANVTAHSGLLQKLHAKLIAVRDQVFGS